MSRFHEGDGEGGAFEVFYWANVERACKSGRGQRNLRDFIDILLAMPRRRLIADAIATREGDVCAVGAYARAKGVDLEPFMGDADDSDTCNVGQAAGLSKMMAFHLGFLNDVEYGTDPVFRFPNNWFAETQPVMVEVWDYRSNRTGRVSAEIALAFVGPIHGRFPKRMTDERRWEFIYRWACDQVKWNLPAVVESVAA